MKTHNVKCIECKSDNTNKKGFYRGKQRYQCMDCWVTFNLDSLTEAYRREVVDYYNSVKNYKEVRRKYGHTYTAVKQWVYIYNKNKTDG